MITTLKESINDDLVSMVVNLLLEDGLSSDSDEESGDEDKDLEEDMTLIAIEDKARALLAIQMHRYINPQVKIEKVPEISDFLLNCLEDKRFKREF